MFKKLFFSEKQCSKTKNVKFQLKTYSQFFYQTVSIQPTEIFISGVEDKVRVMSSIQRPKAFTFIGSDGIKYPFLAKAGDDLSLDARVSELFRLFDHFLANDKKSRELNLSLRSYFVVPLGEKKGLIEWIPNLKGFKDCCKPIYTREGRGQYMEWKTDWKGPDILRMKVKICLEIQP